MTDTTGSCNKSSSRAHSRNSQGNESEESVAVILGLLRKKPKFSTTPDSKKVFTNKCVIDGQPEVAVWPSKPEVLSSSRNVK